MMRHAKSDWDARYSRDHERPLDERGVRSARLMGRVLEAKSLVPELIMSSTAVRARTTAQLAVQAAGWVTPIHLESGFYDSGPGAVVARTARAPDVGRLMIVGHQPTWGLLVEHLTGSKVEMKTGTVVVVDFSIDSWADLPGSRGRVAGVHEPKSYFGGEWDAL